MRVDYLRAKGEIEVRSSARNFFYLRFKRILLIQRQEFGFDFKRQFSIFD